MKINKINLQQFAEPAQPTAENTAFDGGAYGDPTKVVNEAIAGKDVIVSIWNATGDKLLAIKGQKGLKVSRKANSIDISTKDTDGGWVSKMAGAKEWSLDTDGLYVMSDESHQTLGKAFENSSPVLVKITNKKIEKDMFGGLASITDYSFEAPFDDAMTYSISLEGMGALVDLTAAQTETSSNSETEA